MASVTDRYSISSFTAVATANLGGVQGPSGAKGYPLVGANLLIDTNGNFEANLLADHFGDSVYTDVTTFFFGAATFTQAKKFAFVAGYLPWSLRINVTSVQATKYVRVAAGY
jgi:hypothetical protein